MSQMSFASLAFHSKKKVTRREHFLQEMNKVVPWETFEKLVEPHYPKAGNGRRPMPLGVMLRIYFMQQWFNLSDPGMEDQLYESISMQRFAGLELGQDPIPDETTILHFRHLLEKHHLTEQMFSLVRDQLQDKGILIREGTVTDATIISAAESTKNKSKSRDKEMGVTRKGSKWYFGMKAHVGTDSKRGLVHSLRCTPASVHDSQMADELLHGDEKKVYGDKSYADRSRRERLQSKGVRWRVSVKAVRGRQLTQAQKRWNKRCNRTRGRVEFVFGVVKNLWGHNKVRYKGIAKNKAQFFTLFTLSNLYMARYSLMEA
jgi:transposase, IS5 family